MNKNSNNILVSIIVRTKDRPKLVKKALETICLQTYRPIEAVVVNDGGCDLSFTELQDILKDVSLHYIKLPDNTGRAHAGNVGLQHAQGTYIGFLDDDDELYPEHLMTLVSFLCQSDYKVAYTDSMMVYRQYNPISGEILDITREIVFSHDFDYDRLVFENYIPFMCLLFDRSVIDGSGGFDDSLSIYEDWDLLVRIGEKTPFYHVKKTTADYNQWSSEHQISQHNKDPDILRRAYLQVLKKHISKVSPERIHDYMSDFVQSRHLLKEVRNNYEDCRKRSSEYGDHIGKITAEYGERIGRMTAAQEELRMRINALTEALKERDAVVHEAHLQLTDHNAQIDNLRSELHEKDSRIQSIGEEMQDLTGQIRILHQAIHERESRITMLSDELRAKDPQVQELHHKLRESNNQISELNEEMRNKDLSLVKLRDEKKEFADEVERLGKELRFRDSTIEGINTELQAREARIDALGTELQAREARIDALGTELQAREARIDALGTELQARKARIDALGTELQEQNSRLEHLTGISREYEGKVRDLQREIRRKDDLINAMQITLGWRLLEKYRRMRNRFYNPAERHDTSRSLAIKGVRVLRQQGFMALVHKVNKKFLFMKTVKDSPRPLRISQFSIHSAGELSIHKPIPSKVSVIIPTKNAGPDFNFMLRKITQQEGVRDVELIIVDSGSSDGTVDIARRYTDKIYMIPSAEFHHAKTRNYGASKASSEFLVFTVQDALPVGKQWLYKLIAPLSEDQASAVCAKQIPRSDADLFSCWSFWNHIRYMEGDEDRITHKALFNNFDDLDMRTKRMMASLDNVSLGIRRKLFNAYQFCTAYAEDVDLGVRMLRGGHTLMMQASNAVIHSHNRTALYFLKRSFVDTVSLLDILGLKRQDMASLTIMESISHLYTVLRKGIMTICDGGISGEDPEKITLSLIDYLGKKQGADDKEGGRIRGEGLLDAFFREIQPQNHPKVVGDLSEGVSDGLRSFSVFMTSYRSLDSLEKDFINSIYKIFSVTAGSYLGANTFDAVRALREDI